MNAVVPPGYAVPRKEITQLMEELRQSRAAELSNASEPERVRIEKEIRHAVEKKVQRKKSILPRGLIH